jgi:glycosyltransferase involved in cell wall biosynthesis
MSSKQKTIVILTPGFPANEADSTCLPAQQNLVRAINKNYPGIKLIVLSFQYPFTKTVYQWHGNTVIALGGRNKGKIMRLLLWQQAGQQLKKINKKNSITGLLSFWCDECAFVADRFAKKYRIAHYCWLLGQDVKKDNRYIKLIGRGKNIFIALSDFVSETLYNNYKIQTVQTIPLGIAADEFAPVTANRDIDILAAGSLIPLKQYTLFIKIIAALTIHFPNIKAMLCGGGPQLAELEAMISELRLTENIKLTGELPHKELLATMQRSKVFLHPSLYEGLGMVCLEALYAGCRVISFVQPVKTEITNWYIVQNEEAMIKKTAALLDDTNAGFHSIMPYAIEESAAAVIKLFGGE